MRTKPLQVWGLADSPTTRLTALCLWAVLVGRDEMLPLPVRSAAGTPLGVYTIQPTVNACDTSLDVRE